VVEDDANFAMVLAELLEVLGHTICAIAYSEAAAVAFMPELMVVDVQLCEGSGFAAVGGIAIRGHVPHVFVNGDASIARVLGPNATVLQNHISNPTPRERWRKRSTLELKRKFIRTALWQMPEFHRCILKS
jgi:CheY-like chemotaxis protein